MQYLTHKKGAKSSNTYNVDTGWWCRGGEICLSLGAPRKSHPENY